MERPFRMWLYPLPGAAGARGLDVPALDDGSKACSLRGRHGLDGRLRRLSRLELEGQEMAVLNAGFFSALR
jgi:hypothetical protein